MGHRHRADLAERQAEIERVAKILQRASEVQKVRHLRSLNMTDLPRKWADEYECMKWSYRAMARAVIRDRKHKCRRAAR